MMPESQTMQDDSRFGRLVEICIVLFFVCYFGGVIGGALLGRVLIGGEAGLMIGGAVGGVVFGLALMAFIGKVDPEMLLAVAIMTILGLLLGRAIGQIEEAVEKHRAAQPQTSACLFLPAHRGCEKVSAARCCPPRLNAQ